jgi:hypothetical protein
MTKYVYDFTEGDKDQRDLLGGKGANLAEVTKLGCRCRDISARSGPIAGLDPREAGIRHEYAGNE